MNSTDSCKLICSCSSTRASAFIFAEHASKCSRSLIASVCQGTGFCWGFYMKLQLYFRMIFDPWVTSSQQGVCFLHIMANDFIRTWQLSSLVHSCTYCSGRIDFMHLVHKKCILHSQHNIANLLAKFLIIFHKKAFNFERFTVWSQSKIL